MKRLISPVLFAVVLIFMAFKEYNYSQSELMDNQAASPKVADNGIVVLELFTSQGCSSCPAADTQLEKAKKNYPKNVFALSYHVDYWNYIGWEDPFSNSAYTLKQREYNQKFRSRSNYTPQLVVNGKEHFVGSNGVKMNSKIQEYSNRKVENKITVTVQNESGKVNFDYEVLGDLTHKRIRAVLVLNERTTAIKRGENRNRVLKNSNIVVAEKYIEISNNRGSGFVEIPNMVNGTDRVSLMLLIQNIELDITGAAKVELDS